MTVTKYKVMMAGLPRFDFPGYEQFKEKFDVTVCMRRMLRN
jgi:hypothetical protein